MDIIIYNNTQKELEYLKREFNILKEENFRLKEEITTLTQNCDNCENIEDAIENEHILCLDKLKRQKWITIDFIEVVICKNKIKILDFCLKNKNKFDDDLILIAIKLRKIEIVKYLHSIGLQFNFSHLQKYVEKDNLEMVKYILSFNEVQKSNFFTYASAGQGSITMLKYLHSNGFSINPNIINNCCKSFDCIKYVIENGSIPTKETIKNTCSSNNTRLLNYLLDIGCEYTIDELLNSILNPFYNFNCFKILYIHNKLYNKFEIPYDKMINILEKIEYIIKNKSFKIDDYFIRKMELANYNLEKFPNISNHINKIMKTIEKQKNACKTLLEYELPMDVIKYEVCKYF